MTELDVSGMLESIQAKLDRILELLQSPGAPPRERGKRARPEAKPNPLTTEEVRQLESAFNRLYERWMAGDEIAVQGELERMDLELLRRMADAGNLNVNSRTPRQKVLQLIGARFREKRMLHGRTGDRRDQG